MRNGIPPVILSHGASFQVGAGIAAMKFIGAGNAAHLVMLSHDDSVLVIDADSMPLLSSTTFRSDSIALFPLLADQSVISLYGKDYGALTMIRAARCMLYCVGDLCCPNSRHRIGIRLRADLSEREIPKNPNNRPFLARKLHFYFDMP